MDLIPPPPRLSSSRPPSPSPPSLLLPSSSSVDDKALGDGGAPGNVMRGRSIAERRAAKSGFKAERINTARFRTTSPLASPALRSPCLTIPPGISPAALLDSPILLPNCQISPTTGTFPLLHPNYDGGTNACSTLFPGFGSSENQGNEVDLQAFAASMDQSMDFEFPAECSKEATAKSCMVDSATDTSVFSSMVVDADISAAQMCRSDEASNQTSLQRECIPGEGVVHHSLEEQKETTPATGIGRTSEDGYNWRKYGQKQVKGSEYPRSYYKCTHPNCQVKKKVEHSYDGQITEIIYKGAHNHPKPQPSRRPPLGSVSSFNVVPEMDEGNRYGVKVETGSVWRKLQPCSKDNKLGYDWRADGLERTSSTSVITELSDPVSATQAKSLGTFESAGTPELSSTLASHDDDDDDEGANQGSISLGVDADDESESKRRKIDSCLVETNLASRAVREPRVVVQIESEVDILDDGYRWRKYGQKVVKGNPNPRSYYKCTSAGCTVRKHVERASHNLKYVITTYEGKHNHEVPAARNSNHANSSSGNLSQPTANGQPTLALARNTDGSKPETQIQDFVPALDRKPVINDYLRPNFPGTFSNEMKLGVSSIYPLKLPVMQNTMPYGSFGFNSNGGATHHSSSMPSLVLDFPMSLPSSLHTPANLSLAAAVGFNNSGKPVGQVQSFLSGRQLIHPKQEQKDDNLCDSRLSIIDHGNAPSSSSSSVYQHIMANFP